MLHFTVVTQDRHDLPLIIPVPTKVEADRWFNYYEKRYPEFKFEVIHVTELSYAVH